MVVGWLRSEGEGRIWLPFKFSAIVMEIIFIFQPTKLYNFYLQHHTIIQSIIKSLIIEDEFVAAVFDRNVGHCLALSQIVGDENIALPLVVHVIGDSSLFQVDFHPGH